MGNKNKQKDIDVDKVLAEREEYLNGWKRALADYENLQKESAERTSSRVQAETDKFVHELLSIADMYDQAMKHVPEKAVSEPWMQGFKHIQKQLENLLEQLDVRLVRSEGEFDPELHEAVEAQEHEEKPDNHVISVVSKGYTRNNKLIRPSKVIVNKLSN